MSRTRSLMVSSYVPSSLAAWVVSNLLVILSQTGEENRDLTLSSTDRNSKEFNTDVILPLEITAQS